MPPLPRRRSVGGTERTILRRVRALEAAPPPAQFDIKVFSDLQLTTTGDGKFIWAVPADLNGTRLLRGEAYVTTNGSTFTLVQIRNITQAVDLLTTRIRIDASEPTSYTSSVPSVAATTIFLATGNLIAIDVDNAGTGSKGLGVILDVGA